MYHFREVEKSEPWDNYAETFARSTFINSSTWGKFQTSMGVNYIPIGIFDEDSLEGLIPVKIINAKRGKYLHIQHGPLIDWSDMTLRDETLDFIEEYARNKGLSLVRISPLISDSEENRKVLSEFGYIPSTAHEVDAEHTLVLDLTLSDEEILKQMRKNTRYYVRKAEKLEITTEIFDDMSMFDTFWEIFTDAVDRNKWTAYSKDYIQNEFEIFLKDNRSKMFLSKYKGKYISAAIFTYFNGQSFYHHSGSLTEFRNIPSTYALQWEAIKYAKSIGCREHNFWGVVDKDQRDHPWYGLSLFKYGFGGEERKTVHAHDLILNIKGRAMRVFEFLEKKYNGY